VDRRFNRARYEGLQRVDRFLDELRAGRIEPEALGAVLAEAVPDPSLRLFFWLPRDGAHADARADVSSPSSRGRPPGGHRSAEGTCGSARSCTSRRSESASDSSTR
ncbi:MAG: hypothetical protein ACRDMA_09615, partial [Solirubrobacterales bacterium]